MKNLTEKSQSSRSNYIDWLMYMAHFSGSECANYYGICQKLFDIEFVWKHPLDENRAQDGLYLRKMYGKNADFGPCRVLEMLIMLAIRVDKEYVGDPRDPHPNVIFVKFLENLHLISGKNRVVYDQNVIKNSIFDWMNDDRGAVFGLYKVDGWDFSRTQMWDIMFKFIKKL